jgi:hypothetical protein
MLRKVRVTFSLSTNFEPYGRVLVFLQIFRFPDARFDGHKVAAILSVPKALPATNTHRPDAFRDVRVSAPAPIKQSGPGSKGSFLVWLSF